MSEMKSHDPISALEVKVQTLIADHKRLQSLLHEAAQQLRSLEESNRTLHEENQIAQREIARLQLIEALAGGDDDEHARDRARARVNRLIREIDSCIALLNE